MSEENQPEGVVIRLRDNGPMVVSGPITLIDAEGNTFDIPGGKGNAALCRCGESANKPFCDGAHKGSGFTCDRRAAGPA
jgi:CDGSH-type Zn-finger protein